MSAPGTQTATSSPWAAHRPRGQALRERHRYAAEMLGLYLALLDTWEEAWRAARADQPEPRELAGWAAKRVFPSVATATERFGPPLLATAVGDLRANGAIEPLLAGWLAGDEPAPVERYLARAVLRGPLEAVDAAAACDRDPSPRGERNCPYCGGRPQLSFRTDADDALVSGRRYLACARCGRSWNYSASACASCGETTGARRTVFAEHDGQAVVGRRNGHPLHGELADPHSRPRGELADRTRTSPRSRPRGELADPRSRPRGEAAADPPMLPHLRIEGCESCSRYLIDIDLGVDARAVPEVDELTALPLDLFATERGLSKIAPNLMGF